MSKNQECSYCKNKIKSEDKFCASCGKRLSREREKTNKKKSACNSIEYCYNCGAPNQCNDVSCLNCEIVLHPGSKKTAMRHYRAGIVGKKANTVLIVNLCINS